jgi:outer membrane protein W
MLVTASIFPKGVMAKQIAPSTSPELVMASPWSLEVGTGISLPLNKDISKYFNSSLILDGSLGYRLSPDFTLLVNVNHNTYHTLATIGLPLTVQWPNMNVWEGNLLGKYYFSNSSIRPYIFAGPGIATTTFEVRGFQSNTHILLGSTETNFVATAGLGLQFQVCHQWNAFIQGAFSFDFTNKGASSLFSLISTTLPGLPRPTTFLPVEVGLIYNL